MKRKMKKAIELIERGTITEFKTAFDNPKDMMNLLVTDSLGLFKGTLLHYAVNYRKLSFVKYFVQLGADIESTLGTGHSPLYEAILSRSTTIAQYLIDEGADKHTTNQQGENLFYAIVQMRYGDRSTTKVKLLSFLIGLGLDINEKNEGGRTILFELVKWDEPKVLNCLLCHGADVNIQDKYGYTAMHVAAAKDCVQICRLLLKAGGALNQENHYGWTPLDMAVVCDSKSTIEFLAGEKALLSVNNIGLEILRHILSKKEHQIVPLLSKLDDPNLYDYNQLSLLNRLVREEAVVVVKEFLKKNDVELEGALNMACFKGNYLLVKLLLNYGANPNQSNKNGSPLYNLLMFSKLDDNLLNIVQLLLDNGLAYDPTETNFRGNILDLILQKKSTELNTMLEIL